MRWDPGRDTLIFRRYADIGDTNVDTKTSVASLLAQPFDPLGLISPYILQARAVLKKTFQEGINWQEPLKGQLLAEWRQWVDLLPQLRDVSFPRHTPFNETTEIHVFGDASSNMGHGVAAYTRTFHKDTKKFSTHLLCAKSRINPMKDETVPRLELIAALAAATVADIYPYRMKCPQIKNLLLLGLGNGPLVAYEISKLVNALCF